MGRTKRGAQSADKKASKKSKVDVVDPSKAEAHAEDPKPAGEAATHDEPIQNSKPANKGKAGLSAGDDLPSFEVETDETTEEAKTTVSSAELVKESGLIIFFYPKANTGGCTTQARGFNEHVQELEKAGYKVFGMSADKPKSQANWKAKHGFKFNLLCDPSFEVLKQLGVTKGAKGINRSHIIVEKGGKVKDVRIGISPKDSVAEAVKTCTSTE